MKDTKQIAADCGTDEYTLEQVLNDSLGTSTVMENDLCEMVGALYRRIEKLETDIDIAQLILGDPGALLKHILNRMSGAQLLTLFMAGGVDTTLAKRIEKLEEDRDRIGKLGGMALQVNCRRCGTFTPGRALSRESICCALCGEVM